VIHFDFDDRYQDELIVGSAISKREGVLLSSAFHAAILALILFGPEWTFLNPDHEELEARQEELLRQQREREEASRRFVFVQPRVEIEAKAPPQRAERESQGRDNDREEDGKGRRCANRADHIGRMQSTHGPPEQADRDGKTKNECANASAV